MSENAVEFTGMKISKATTQKNKVIISLEGKADEISVNRGSIADALSEANNSSILALPIKISITNVILPDPDSEPEENTSPGGEADN